MAETVHARSRMAAIIGLILQIAATAAVFLVAGLTRSVALAQLTWMLGGGIIIWIGALLVFRQHELADLEALDLEELRREKQAAGGEALFDESTGYLVARNRLEWMQRYLMPAFGLVFAAYLVTIGLLQWSVPRQLGSETMPWPALNGKALPLAMIVLSIIMLLQFFMARYAAGLANESRWQMLRGPGSFMLLNSVVNLAVIITFGLALTRGDERWEHAVAYAVPLAMIVLGIETLLLFIADIYRPRSPGVEARACFDSRILAILTLPGGLAAGLSEAVNYQFGFQVSQTWFYRLLQTYAPPLAMAGAVAVWLLTSIVVINPHERAVIERFGRQVNAEQPLTPGLHLKLPAPFERAYKYNTGQVHAFVVGYKSGDSPEYGHDDFTVRPPIELWTDAKHSGREHFDFIIAPSGGPGGARAATQPAPAGGRNDRAAVNLIRLHALVQYRIRADQLHLYTRSYERPDEQIRRIAWNEVLRFNATATIDDLMSERREEMGARLRERIAAACDAQQLGLEVIYVGIIQAHPESTVAKAFSEVVNARQQVIANIRTARVEENKLLSGVAGDRQRAIDLAEAIDRINLAEQQRSQAERVAAALPAGSQTDDRFAGLAELHERMTAADAAHRAAAAELAHLKGEHEVGLGQSRRSLELVEQAVAEALAARDAARSAYEAAAEPIRAALRGELGEEVGAAAAQAAEARLTLAYWNARLETLLVGLEGVAAVRLAEAQAQRWQREMKAAGEVAVLQNERYAYEAAPEIYRARRFLEVIENGLSRARKYFVALDDPERVKLRIEAQEQARPSLEQTSLSDGRP